MTGRLPHFSRRNAIVIACCVGLTLTVILLGPFLQLQQKNSLDRQIAESRKRIQVLKRAAELRQQLQERITGLQTVTEPLPVTTEPLASDQADQVLAELHRLADQASVSLVDVRPNLESMGQNSKSMQIGATVYGNMTGFQNMLNNLLQIPYVERLQRMVISAESEKLQLQINFTVHIK
jgi:hypothetical protein